MDEQNNQNSFPSPVQPQQPRPNSVVQPQPSFGDAFQPQQPASGSVVQPQQPFGEAFAQPQQPWGGSQGGPTYQQPMGGQPATPPAGYAESPFTYGTAGSYQPPANTGKATAALVLGIAAIVVCFVLPIVGAPLGIILGIVAIVMGGSYIKVNGPFGRAKAGRICGIVGLVLSVLSLLLALALVALFGVMGASLYDEFSSTGVIEEVWPEYDDAYDYDYDYDFNFDPAPEPDYSYSFEAAPLDLSALSEEERSVVELVESEFNMLAEGEAGMLDSVGAIAGEGFLEATGLGFAECGIDPLEYAGAITQGMSFVVEEVYLEGDTGYVGVNVTCKDIYDVHEDVYEDLSELASAPGAEGMSDEEYNQHAGQILMAAVRDAELVPGCNWAIIDVERVGGEWTINQETWDFEMDYMFSLV